GRALALACHARTDAGQQPTPGARERRERPFQRLANRRVAGANEAPPQPRALTARKTEALGGFRRHGIDRDAVAQYLDRLDEGVVERRDAGPEIARTPRAPPCHEHDAQPPGHPPPTPPRAAPLP